MRNINTKKILLFISAVILVAAGVVYAINAPTTSPPAGDTVFWRLNGTSIYYNGGNVGVGISSPSSKFQASGGDIYVSGYIRGGNRICIGSDCRTNWSDVPQSAIAFFATSTCPTGWTELTTARGRYLVGLPSGGTLAGTAGTALSNLENRPVGQHTHTITDPGHYHGTDGVLVGPFPGVTSYAFGNGGQHFNPSSLSGTYSDNAYTGITINATGTVAGTNSPYIQLLTCQKT